MMRRQYTLLAGFLAALAWALIVSARPAAAQTPTGTPTPTATAGPSPTPTLTNPTSLETDLSSCWALDEASGTRFDAFGANDLTDNNTVGSVSGKKNVAAYYQNANSEYLSHTSNDSLFSSEYTIAGWLYRKSSNIGFLGKGTDYSIGYTSVIYFQHGDGYNNVYGPSLNTDTWYFFVAWYSSNNIYLQINNGQLNQSAATLDTSNSGSTFYLGAGPFAAAPWDGYADEIAFWRRALTEDERAWLFNYGNGRSCADIESVITPTPTPTPSPTPGGEARYYLSSGDWATVDRTVTYGDLGVMTFFGSMGAFAIVYSLYWINRSSTGKL